MTQQQIETQLTGVYARAVRNEGGAAELAKKLGTNANSFSAKKSRYGLRNFAFWQIKLMAESAGLELIFTEKAERR